MTFVFVESIARNQSLPFFNVDLATRFAKFYKNITTRNQLLYNPRHFQPSCAVRQAAFHCFHPVRVRTVCALYSSSSKLFLPSSPSLPLPLPFEHTHLLVSLSLFLCTLCVWVKVIRCSVILYVVCMIVWLCFVGFFFFFFRWLLSIVVGITWPVCFCAFISYEA